MELTAVNHSEQSITVTLSVNEHEIRFQLDSAADVNTICQKHVTKHQVSPLQSDWDAVKEKLDQLVLKGVLAPLTEPTEWVSQMAVLHKPDGKLCMPNDPQPLNVPLKSEHYRLPVLDNVLPKLKDAKVFSKLDVKEVYWHV